MNSNFFGIMDISGSGLTAERFRMDIIADNIANAETTRTPEGGPYKRKVPIFAERVENSIANYLSEAKAAGVRVIGIHEDNSPPRLVYDPTNPDADANGYVKMPNVNVVREMVDMISAQRAYEANISVISSARSMVRSALDIGRA
ncbi:MAG: flagellar basal body rod protein FlgC [Thermotoga sp.]|nr:MAG: flagellar basal body rod protein FlgC [Thermotoga sp.]